MSKAATQDARMACVIGWPVAHSRSPLIHNYWIGTRPCGRVPAQAVRPEGFSAFVRRLAERGYVGANVTVPHKEAALDVAEPDARAQAVGAANTLWLADGKLCATNTDVEGFLANLDATVAGWNRGLDTAVVLGAGGAARAVVFALAERGVAAIHVANRSFERAVALRERFAERVTALHWNEAPEILPRAGLLVNATTLGMTGQPALDLDLGRLPARAVVCDLVMCRSTPRCCRSARARIAGRRARHAPAPGGRGICSLVRGAPTGDGGLAPAGGG
jgi:shikimate dehydrogenase